jgi:HAD superfamily hydrolase (TIGR01509 family)
MSERQKMRDPKNLLSDLINKARAFVFDMDGVLVDSEKHHFLAHQKALGECGIALDKSFYITHGVSTDPALFYVKAFNQKKLLFEGAESIVLRKRQLYRELQKEEGIVPIKPAAALVKALDKKKIPLAVASAVPREEVKRIIKELKVERCFSVIVAGDDVPLRNKPFPDIYLQVAERLKIPPAYCIAIEDSGNGAHAALGAGMGCVVVPNDYTRSHDFGGAFVFQTFTEVEKIIITNYELSRG